MRLAFNEHPKWQKNSWCMIAACICPQASRPLSYRPAAPVASEGCRWNSSIGRLKKRVCETAVKLARCPPPSALGPLWLVRAGTVVSTSARSTASDTFSVEKGAPALPFRVGRDQTWREQRLLADNVPDLLPEGFTLPAPSYCGRTQRGVDDEMQTNPQAFEACPQKGHTRRSSCLCEQISARRESTQISCSSTRITRFSRVWPGTWVRVAHFAFLVSSDKRVESSAGKWCPQPLCMAWALRSPRQSASANVTNPKKCWSFSRTRCFCLFFIGRLKQWDCQAWPSSLPGGVVQFRA